jgi:tetratricopeptide (TPR) repeat protein
MSPFFMKKTFYFLLIVFIVSCNQTAESTGNDQLTEVANDSIINSVNSKDISLSAIENYIIQKPESSNGYYKRAIYYKEKNKYNLAIEDINRAITISPDAPVINYEKASILYEYGVFSQDISLIDESKIYLDHCISLDEDFELSKLLKAKLFLFEKKTDESMVLVNDVLKLNSSNSEAYLIKGMIYNFLGNTKLAQSSYQTAIEANPDYYDAYILLGILYEKMGDETAVNYYNSAAEINPNGIEAFRNKGLFYHFNQQYSLARISFEKVIDIDSTFEEAFFNIGNTFLGEYAMDTLDGEKYISEAMKFYNKAISINPYYVQSIHNIGICYEIIGDKLKAKEQYLYAVKLDNNYTPSLNALNDL